MDQQPLIDALVARAAAAAQTFRTEHPDDTPTDLWIENIYTAALPLAKADTGIDPGVGPHPQLFAAFRRAIEHAVGERELAPPAGEVRQMPTPGER
jgi:hypothetical protein